MNITVSLNNGELHYSCDDNSVSLPRFFGTYRDLATKLNFRPVGAGWQRFIGDGVLFDFAKFPNHSAREIVVAIAHMLEHYLINKNYSLVGHFAHVLFQRDLIDSEIVPADMKLVLNNRVYDLVPSPDNDGTGLVQQAVDSANEQVHSYSQLYNAAVENVQSEVNRRVREIEEQYRNNITIPSLSYQDVIVKGLRVYITDKQFTWLLPFNYAPKYVVNKFGEQGVRNLERKLITEKFQKQIKQTVVLSTITENNIIVSVRLFNPSYEVFNDFNHYHRGCFGTWRAPDSKLTLPSDLYAIRDQLEKELEIINAASVAVEHPHNMPRIQDIEQGIVLAEPGHTTESVGGWTI